MTRQDPHETTGSGAHLQDLQDRRSRGPGASGCFPDDRGGRIRRDHGTFRFRKIHADASFGISGYSGEEEIGSEHLDDFIKDHKELLACDFCLNTDAGILAPDKPSITTGLRGLAYFELRVNGPSKDLHSGIYGGTVHNPAQALAELIAGMHDKDGKITLPGFYDKVRKLSKKEHKDFARLPLNKKLYLEQTGVPALWGEHKFTPPERLGARPTLEVNGLLSGFTGPGSKTVLPAWAMAKISCRLVPDQTPEQTIKQMKKYLKEKAPKDITWELKYLHGAGAALVSKDNIGVKAMSQVHGNGVGKETLLSARGRFDRCCRPITEATGCGFSPFGFCFTRL